MLLESPSDFNFEGLETKLENVEFLPNEPMEAFLFRVSGILRMNLPNELKTDILISFQELEPGRLLFSRSEIYSVLDRLISRKMEYDKANPMSKVRFFKDDDVVDFIGSSFTHVYKGKVDLSTDDTSRRTFDELLNDRYFFNNNLSREGMIDRLFLLDNPQTEEQLRYLDSILRDKSILLVGGGNSCEDLLDSKIGIKKIVNIDPFLSPKSGSVHADYGIYRHFGFASQDKDLVDKLGEGFDEIWANYSVPMYSRTSEDIKDSLNNMVSLLNVGGTIRIFPLLVGYDYSLPENERLTSDSMFDSLRDCIEELDGRDDVNVFYIPTTIKQGGTLFIKKLK